MKISTLLILFVFPIVALLASCNENSKQKKQEQEEIVDIRSKVDRQSDLLKSSISEFNFILSIDHSRLAEEAGVYTPPSIVSLFSRPKVNSELIRINPLIGLDLPYKVLCYSEPDTTNVSISYTASTFIQQRHGITEDDMKAYKKDMEKVIGNFPKSQVKKTTLEKVDINYGIIILNSDFDFETTIQKLKNIVESQSDTKWFGEIDFQKDALKLNIEIDKSTLLLFGGPAPGGQAMFDSPRLGLDAFCQKLLVFENENNKVLVAFNNIPAFAELYYNRSTKPQEMINQRLKTLFTKVLSNN
jgi:uncharacterized protein (DUF302 family)